MLLEYIRINNIIPKLVSLVLATLLWFIVHSRTSELSTISTSIRKPKLPKGFVLSKGWASNRLGQVEFRGDDWQSSVSRKNYWYLIPKLQGKAKIGENTFRLELNQKVPDNQSADIEPEFIKLFLSKAVTKVVPVRVSYEKDDDQFLQLEIIPESVRVQGPADQIENINYIYTDQLTLTSGQSIVDSKLKLKTEGNLVDILGTTEVKVKGNIVDKANYEARKLTLNYIESKNLSDELATKIIPNKVTIQFMVPKSEIEVFEDKEADISAFVNCSKFYRKQKTVFPSAKDENAPIELAIPPSLKNIIILDKKPERVSLIVRVKDS